MNFRIFLYCIVFAGALGTASAQNCVGTPGQVRWSYWGGFKTYLPDTSDLAVLENFPTRPDGSQILFSTQAPQNYTEQFAAMIRGYIYVNQTDTYQFNVTGDDRVLFYLSTNELPANKRKRAETTTHTDITQHNKQASQTSQTITLQAGVNYYFELYTFEGGWSDHTTLFWRRTTNSDTTWRIIGYENLKDYACGQTCAPRGTPCNDNNPLTTNDQQDGFCNCVGNLATTNTCVGSRGVVEAYYYDNVAGSYVEPDLINAPKFPLLPDRRERLTAGASAPNLATYNDAYVKNQYGSMLQGYLTVPQTGMYEFNITGDDQTIFYLSKNDSLEYKQHHQALTVFGIDETAHNTYSFQSTSPILLEKGKYYYYEIRNKENGWRDHFNLYWKTPFHEQRTWKRISNFYLFDYKCELSCVPNNTPCDDGNPLTNNDRFQNCECVGTPCTGPNCNDPEVRYQKYPTCAPTDNVINTSNVAWESCTKAANPNPARAGTQHWIRYDFGEIYRMKDTRIWNYNAQNQTNKGFKTVFVDYSLDGVTWQQLGNAYSWLQAPGTNEYAGFLGPNFNDVKARYVLITATENYGHATCAGISKLTLNATPCKPSGTLCDDGDPLTFYDKYDNNCNCKGVKLACLEDTIRTGKVVIADPAHKARKAIIAEGTIAATKNISFTAGNSIVLLPGVEISNGATFEARIEGCIQAMQAQQKGAPQSSASEFGAEPTESQDIKRIIFRLNKPSHVKLLLKDAQGKTLATIIDNYYQNLGTQTKLVPTNRLAKGTYTISLEANETKVEEPLIIN
jgi:PA14 domain/F5/8 type C domain